MYFRCILVLALLLTPVLGVLHAAHAPFVIFTPPKTGTRLCGKTLSLITGEEPRYYTYGLRSNSAESIQLIMDETQQGNFVVSHSFVPEELAALVSRGYKIIFMVRDPRDHLVSVLNWLHEGQWEYLAVHRIQDPVNQMTDLMSGCFTGYDYVYHGFLIYESFTRGLPADSLYIAHFEKLVGSQGGGSDELQVQEVRDLAAFINQPLTDEEIYEMTAHIFGGTTTFRKGQIGVWKTAFTDQQKNLFKDRYNHLLLRLGYETNASWCQ